MPEEVEKAIELLRRSLEMNDFEEWVAAAIRALIDYAESMEPESRDPEW